MKICWWVVNCITQQSLSISGLPPATLLESHSGMMKCDGSNPSTMRLLYYPPVPPEDDDPCCQNNGCKYTRCGAHADYGTFTLLAQDSEGGLEVRQPTGLSATDKLTCTPSVCPSPSPEPAAHWQHMMSKRDVNRSTLDIIFYSRWSYRFPFVRYLMWKNTIVASTRSEVPLALIPLKRF